MSFAARVFRILIASPSDVTEERDLAVSTIQAWNDINSAERQLVLLPLRWETHSAPEFGKRPQEVINRQVVDHCDLLIGIFWTRIGSSTGIAESGTLEEIERVAGQGKPVMLYFSQLKQDPDRIDLEQLRKLRDFKQKTFPKSLVETYSTQVEFRDKLAKQIEIQLRSLIAQEASSGDPSSLNSSPITDIQLEFADTKDGTRLGAKIALKSVSLKVIGNDRIPDYDGHDLNKPSIESSGLFTMADVPNKDYYREVVEYSIKRNGIRPIRFWLKNAGGVGARDVYVDLRIFAENREIPILLLGNDLNAPNKSRTFSMYFSRGGASSE